MLLAEELILLTLDDDDGHWLVRRRAMPRAVQIALVVELLGRRAIALDDKGVLIAGRGAATEGDRVLERVAGQVVGRRPQDLPEPGNGDLRELLARLRKGGVLRRPLLRRRRHLPRDHHPEAAVRARMLEILRTRFTPDRHHGLLVAIVFELGLMPTLFADQSDVTALTKRAEEINEQLHSNQHYFAMAVPAEAAAKSSEGISTGDVLEGLQVAVEGLDAMANLVELVSLPFRILGAIGDLLP